MYTSDQEVQQTLLYMYADLAGNSILIYDHIVTLQEEITFIWRRPKALSAVLFLLNRYVALLSNICGLIKDFVPVSDEVLQFHYACTQRLMCSQPISVELFEICAIQTTGHFPPNSDHIMVIRTYALYGCSKRLLAWMVIATIALTGIACAGTFGQFSGDIEVVPGLGCNETFSKSMAARIGLAYVALFVFDLIIFVLTVHRIYKARNLLRLSLSDNTVQYTEHSDVLHWFREHTNTPCIQFDCFLMMGKVNLRGSLSTFTGCMSVTLISRLMLNLHQTIETGVLSTPVQDEGPGLPVLTTRISVESVVSSHYQ
ncbi:hypothetical protein C8R48DRAFT_772992 [Suillus tomentosus]|nr:hypothetical protein C8R48DRAFT_772992 [Suillus tomentosus]